MPRSFSYIKFCSDPLEFIDLDILRKFPTSDLGKIGNSPKKWSSFMVKYYYILALLGSLS